MDTMETILARTSVRHFTQQPISDEDIHRILTAGMTGPTCVNAREWAFLVIRDPEMLARMAEGNGRPADPLRRANVGILACGDLSRAFYKAPDYWIVDVSIAVQNMTLCAQELGIGSVWLGTWPQPERIQAQRELFSLPEHIVPHSILALGYPDEAPKERKPPYEEDRVHWEKW